MMRGSGCPNRASSSRGRYDSSDSRGPISPGDRSSVPLPESPLPEQYSPQVGSSAMGTTLGSTGIRCIELMNGNLHPSSQCSHRITAIFKERLDVDGSAWKTVSQETKEFYWEEFKKYFTWDESIEAPLKLAWHQQAGRRYSDMLSKFRRRGDKPKEVPQDVWNKWQQDWATDQFRFRATQASKNRFSETGGLGVSPSRHTGGSISLIEHTQRLATELGYDPNPFEVFKRTHTKSSDDGQQIFVDKRSKDINDRVELLATSASQSEEGDAEQQDVDIRQVYLEAVGGEKKRRVYGLGSQASGFYTLSPGTSSTVRSHMPPNAERDDFSHE